MTNDDGISQQDSGVNNIAIVFCVTSAYSVARKIERLADEEIIEVTAAVKAGLEHHGYHVDPIKLDPENIDVLTRYDYVFNLVESIYGFPLTDYEITERLENLGIPFTGSSSETLRSCLDKSITKKRLLTHRITTPNYIVIDPGAKIEIALTYPVIVKPVHEDGCVGISSDSMIRNQEQLIIHVRNIHDIYKQSALIEEYIDGRDITASILGNGDSTHLLPLSEILYSKQDGPGHLTFNANWVPGSSDYQESRSVIIDHMNPILQTRIQTAALSAYRVMGCRDYARVDFRVRGNTPYMLEVNPNPCINPDGSGFVKSAEAAGFSYSDLVKAILEMSINSRQPFLENRQEMILV
jgi:D-alanine-D-alanine ligase